MTATITPIVLKNLTSGQAIDAELLDAVEQQQLIDWVIHWLPARDKYLNTLKTAQAPAAAWPQSAHWNWVNKVVQIQGLLAHQALCVVCEKITQGMMRIVVAGTDDNGDKHRFYFETFNFHYDVLTLGLYLKPH